MNRKQYKNEIKIFWQFYEIFLNNEFNEKYYTKYKASTIDN